jgi:hypothetical protein
LLRNVTWCKTIVVTGLHPFFDLVPFPLSTGGGEQHTELSMKKAIAEAVRSSHMKTASAFGADMYPGSGGKRKQPSGEKGEIYLASVHLTPQWSLSLILAHNVVILSLNPTF